MATSKQSGPVEQHPQPSDTDLIASLLEDQPVTYKPLVAKALKSTEAARKMKHVTAATVFFSNVMYWTPKKGAKARWTYRTGNQIEEETGLSRFEQSKARTLLVAAGVMEEGTFKAVPEGRHKDEAVPMKHYRVLYDGLLPLLRQQLDRELSVPESESNEGSGDEKTPANPGLRDSVPNRDCETVSQTGLRDSVTNGFERQCDNPYTHKAGREANKKVDSQSVDPSSTHTREGSTVDSEAGPTDRPTDRLTEENAPTKNTEASTTVQLLEPEEPHHEQSNTVVLSPQEDDDNDSPSAEEALRQRTEALRASVEAISNDEVSEEAQQLGREVLAGLPPLSDGRDRCRVGKLAEHYLRGQRPNVLRDATDRVARQSRREKINSVWRYLTKSCAEAEDGYSEGDEALLRSLSGENTRSTSEESDASGYEMLAHHRREGGAQSDAGEDEQRQHTPEPDPEALAVWEKILEDVSGEINAPSLRVWFEGTVPVSLTADTLTISVPNSFAREYIESRFLELLEGTLAKVLSPTSGLEIVVGLDEQTANKGGG